ncbi:glycyl-radical enzyme activating protein [Acetobacterium wieringae]|nr:glycyl-radical enzyme activating protein [Acetobacterium wieringae]
MVDKNMSGTVLNIQRFTIHDGPGIRTEVFLKGCPLQCRWCSNPESMKVQPEVGVNKEACLGIDHCGWCVDKCPNVALILEEKKIVAIDREKCSNCLSCATSCPNDTLKIFGNSMTVEEIMKIVRSDRNYYEQSGGGLTLSGGDPLVQWKFSLEILKACKLTNIHTCVETELFCKKEIIDHILPYTDLIITDIKHMDTQKHKLFTNVGNEVILDNIKYIVKNNADVVIRIPIVPGHNNDDENIRITAEFISKELNNRIHQLQLLPYRPLGVDKYASLGLSYSMNGQEKINRDEYKKEIENIAMKFQSYGIPAVTGANKLL